MPPFAAALRGTTQRDAATIQPRWPTPCVPRRCARAPQAAKKAAQTAKSAVEQARKAEASVQAKVDEKQAYFDKLRKAKVARAHDP